MDRRLRERSLGVLGTLFLILLAVAGTGAQSRWSRYMNPRWGFCADYPDGWDLAKAEDQSGIFAFPQGQRGDREPSAIEIGGSSNQENEAGEMKTLDEQRDLAAPDILKRFGPIEELRVIKRKRIMFRGMPATSFSLSYRQAGEEWRSRTIVAVSNDEKTVWRLEMRCRADESQEFEGIFEHMVASFKLQCSQ